MYAIETLRLRLCPMSADYLDDLVQMWRDPDVMRHLPTGQPRPLAETRRELDFITGHWQTNGFGVWRISIKDHEPFVGYCGLQYLHAEPGGVSPERLGDTREVEILYGVTRRFWGKGVAFEAAKSVVRFGFETLELPRIIAAIHPENKASRRILEKLGMQEDPSLRYYNDCPHFVLYRRNFLADNAFYTLQQVECPRP